MFSKSSGRLRTTSTATVRVVSQYSQTFRRRFSSAVSESSSADVVRRPRVGEILFWSLIGASTAYNAYKFRYLVDTSKEYKLGRVFGLELPVATSRYERTETSCTHPHVTDFTAFTVFTDFTNFMLTCCVCVQSIHRRSRLCELFCECIIYGDRSVRSSFRRSSIAMAVGYTSASDQYTTHYQSYG